MKYPATLSLVTLVSSLFALGACEQSPKPEPAPVPAATAPLAAATPPSDARSLVALGEHLVKTSGCGDCHTPLKMGANGPEPDLSHLLAGHPQSMKLPPPPAASPPWLVAAAATNTAWAGPWGVSFTANLTPDPETGLGRWSKDSFVQAIRTGRHQGRGRPILPPMPVPAYQNFTDDELGAIFTYLQSIPAIKNRVPEPLPPPTAKARG